MSDLAFLDGGGKMGALMRSFDWSRTSIGSPRLWPESLRLAVRLVLNARQPMFIWWGPDLVQIYNDAYSGTMGAERHPSALGAQGRDCWSEIWPIIGPDIDAVMSGQGSSWYEEKLVPITRHGRKEQIWWSYSYSPIYQSGEVQEVGGVLVACQDVTAQHDARVELKDRSEQLARMFDLAPSFMAVLSGADHVFEHVNAAYRKLTGDRDCIGKSVRAVFPDVEGQGFFELLDHVYQTAVPHVGKRLRLEMRTEDSNNSHVAFIDFVYAPIFDGSGRVSGVFVEGVDVTEHINNESHLRTINEELQHRVKNTLAVIGAIARQTFHGSNIGSELNAFLGRLGAFAKAHDSLSAHHWATAELRDVVEGAVAPHRIKGSQFLISGPPVTIGSKQAVSFAMALHELSTNAIKYGALSTSRGSVEIVWDAGFDDEKNAFTFTWREIGGPPVATPTRVGFGSKLIKRMLESDLGAHVEVAYPMQGFFCRLSTTVQELKSVESEISTAKRSSAA